MNLFIIILYNIANKIKIFVNLVIKLVIFYIKYFYN